MGQFVSDGTTPTHVNLETAANVAPDSEFDSVNSFRAAKGSGLARIDFNPVPASELKTQHEQIEWIWDGWVAREHTTLLVALPKAGKTTLISHVLAATEHGGEVAGEVRPCRVLVLTEESPTLWATRCQELGIGDNVTFCIRPCRGKPSTKEWESLIESVADYVQQNDVDLVVLDTWQSLTPNDDENDAPRTVKALQPLNLITSQGAGILLVHHARKGDGPQGQAARGSGALTGFVDLIVELRRFDAGRAQDRRRVLTGLGRFSEPSECVIELDESGQYRRVGDKADVTRVDRSTAIAAILPECKPGMTVDEVQTAWPEKLPQSGKRTVQVDLNSGYERGQWSRTGEGKSGSPFRYWLQQARN